MRWTKAMCCAMVWAVILFVGTLAAPVTKTAPEHPEEAAKSADVQSQALDQTANELESLSNKDTNQHAVDETVEVPAVPGSSNDASDSTETEPASSEEVQDDNQAPVNPVPAKRQFAQTEPEGRQLFPEPAGVPAYEQETNFYDEVPEVDLSPRAVAEYLLVTKDFDGFNQALEDLVQSGILSAAEVYQYKDTVSWQYEGLLNEIEGARRPTIDDLLRGDPMEYLGQPGPVYPDVGMSQNNLPMNNQPIDFQDLGIQAPDFRDMQLPAFDMSPRQFGGMKAIPVAERRTERIQKLLLAKQQNLDGLLDVVLNDYYSQPQQMQEQEYNQDYLDNFNPNYDLTDSGDLEQLMEYLQESLDSEEQQPVEQPIVPAAPVEEPSNKPEVPATNDIANELDALPVKQPEAQQSQDTSSVDETSGDDEEQKVNDTKTKVAETSSS